MASKPSQSIYRTAKGAQIDMLKLINQNETTIAVGNMGVNARGDKLGPGGKIIKKSDEIAGTNVPNQIASKKNIQDMDPEGDE
jgi:hypothetical protein